MRRRRAPRLRQSWATSAGLRRRSRVGVVSSGCDDRVGLALASLRLESRPAPQEGFVAGVAVRGIRIPLAHDSSCADQSVRLRLRFSCGTWCATTKASRCWYTSGGIGAENTRSSHLDARAGLVVIRGDGLGHDRGLLVLAAEDEQRGLAPGQVGPVTLGRVAEQVERAARPRESAPRPSSLRTACPGVPARQAPAPATTPTTRQLGTRQPWPATILRPMTPPRAG